MRDISGKVAERKIATGLKRISMPALANGKNVNVLRKLRDHTIERMPRISKTMQKDEGLAAFRAVFCVSELGTIGKFDGFFFNFSSRKSLISGWASVDRRNRK